MIESFWGNIKDEWGLDRREENNEWRVRKTKVWDKLVEGAFENRIRCSEGA